MQRTRTQLENCYSAILAEIESGAVNYSINNLKIEYNAFRNKWLSMLFGVGFVLSFIGTIVTFDPYLIFMTILMGLIGFYFVAAANRFKDLAERYISGNNNLNIQGANSKISDELIKLKQLQRTGVLTEDEFAKAKNKLIS